MTDPEEAEFDMPMTGGSVLFVFGLSVLSWLVILVPVCALLRLAGVL